MRKATGFSLLELMIVIAVIAITLAWAIPSYQDSVRKARRGEAQVNLREFEVCAARQYTVFSDYSSVEDDCQPEDDDYYSYEVDPSPPSLTYTITATPQGDQGDHDKCGTMTLNQSGVATAAVTGCWLSGQTSSS